MPHPKLAYYSPMKKFLPLLALLTGIPFVSANDVAINYSAANDLILTAKTCDKLISQHTAICNWKKINTPSFVVPSITNKLCRKNSNGKFSMTVSSCLPDFVKANQNKKNYKSGANCWGTAMSFKKLSTRPRFIWSNEMAYWLDSPVCRKLNPGEQKQPGDFLNMFGPEYIFAKDDPANKGERFWAALYPGRATASPVAEGYSGYHHFLHTETFLTDNIAFGKDSPSKLDKFGFHQMNEVYGRARETECQENQTLSPHYREYQNQPKEIRGSKCAYFSLAYRCESFPDYFAGQALSTDDQTILATIRELQAVQDKLFPLLMVINTKIPKAQIDQMVKLSDDVADDTLDELGRASTDKNREMLLVLKYFTASGIRKSLELADLIPPTEEL